MMARDVSEALHAFGCRAAEVEVLRLPAPARQSDEPNGLAGARDELASDMRACIACRQSQGRQEPLTPRWRAGATSLVLGPTSGPLASWERHLGGRAGAWGFRPGLDVEATSWAPADACERHRAPVLAVAGSAPVLLLGAGAVAVWRPDLDRRAQGVVAVWRFGAGDRPVMPCWDPAGLRQRPRHEPRVRAPVETWRSLVDGRLSVAAALARRCVWCGDWTRHYDNNGIAHCALHWHKVNRRGKRK